MDTITLKIMDAIKFKRHMNALEDLALELEGERRRLVERAQHILDLAGRAYRKQQRHEDESGAEVCVYVEGLRARHEHKADIAGRAYKRLWTLYLSILKQLNIEI